MVSKKRAVHFTAPQVIITGFATIILVGALLLSLPIASQTGESTHFLDALFVATSATCVTGLTTVTTAVHWSFFGQVVILTLIEVGGLGFISLPVIFYLVTRKKVGLGMRIVLRQSLNSDNRRGEMSLMIYIMKNAFFIQFIGFLLLAVDFIPRFGLKRGAWYSFFHAISAFCNAGFDLFGDSLVGFQQNPWVLSVISGLIISGGLGFLVWYDVLSYKKGKRMSLHSKIALLVTGGLLLFGTLCFMLTERNGVALVEGNAFQRFFNTMFMSVTPRTAGFFSVDYLSMTHAGLLLTIVLMFIGGTSGSTAGGFKTTTFGILIIKLVSIFKGKEHAEFDERTIKESIVSRSLVLFFLLLSLVIISTMILSVTETVPDINGLGLEYIVFEVVSALGTVGLTMGLTPALTISGKLLIILLMFVGRVGIMTVIFSLVTKGMNQKQTFKYPEESVIIG
ncbi:TrkH family potassium uptake protein [Enterococcus sp. LJL98]